MMGNCDRRPSASKMPSGSEKMMPVNEMTRRDEQPAPEAGLHMRQPEHPADQQEEGDDRKDSEEHDRVEPLVGHARDEQRNEQDHAERVGEIGPATARLPGRSRT